VALALGGAALSGSCGARKIDDPGALRKFLAGKEISPAKEGKGFPFSEKFFRNGAWEGYFWSIDLMIEKGTWSVSRNPGGALLLCTKTERVNETVLKSAKTDCSEVEAYEGASTATLIAVSDRQHAFKVTVSPIKQ